MNDYVEVLDGTVIEKHRRHDEPPALHGGEIHEVDDVTEYAIGDSY